MNHPVQGTSRKKPDSSNNDSINPIPNPDNSDNDIKNDSPNSGKDEPSSDSDANLDNSSQIPPETENDEVPPTDAVTENNDLGKILLVTFVIIAIIVIGVFVVLKFKF